VHVHRKNSSSSPAVELMSGGLINKQHRAVIQLNQLAYLINLLNKQLD